MDKPTEQKIEISLDVARRSLLHIAIPCYGGMMTESTAVSLVKWTSFTKEHGITWSFETISNESLINRARNTMVAKWMVDYPDSTHFMFIDADIGFEPHHILLLLSHDVDLIGGLYPLKTHPLKWCVNGLDGVADSNTLLEVSKTGTGFMIIKRHVFERLKSHNQVLQYTNDIGLDKKYDAELYNYFETVVREGRYLSEDWTFCAQWRDLGGRVYVDKRVMLRHSGSYVYSIENQETALQAFGPLYIQRLKETQGIQVIDKDGREVGVG